MKTLTTTEAVRRANEKAQLRAELLQTGACKLRNYLASGIAGFRQQGLDRIREAGINTAACEDSREGLEHLARMIEIGWVM